MISKTLIGVLLASTVATMAHAELSRPQWDTMPCVMEGHSYCDTGKGIVLIAVPSKSCDWRHSWNNEFIYERQITWNRLHPKKMSGRWEAWMETTAKRGYGPPYACGYALMYGERANQ